MKNQIAIFMFLAMSLVLASCSPPPPPEKPKEVVTLQLKWHHQVQFAGFYMAKERGYYAAENIEVNFLEGSKDVDMFERLRAGKADFAIVSGESVISRQAEDGPVKAVAVIYQRSPVVFVARTDANITRPQDFAGKTIAVGGVRGGGMGEALILFNTLMNKTGLQPSDYQTVPYDPFYEKFLSGQADITPVYIGNGVVQLRDKGLNLNIIWPGDYGIPFYSDTLAATAQYLQDHPDLALRFFRASLKGWKDVVEDADAAVKVTMPYVAEKDAVFQRKMADAQMPLVHTGEHPIGWMEPTIWQSMHRTLVAQGIVEKPVPDVAALYSLELLNAYYSHPEKQ